MYHNGIFSNDIYHYIESFPIKEGTSAKYLGVTIDDFALMIFQVALVLLAC